jgi:phage I-like protein
MNTPILNREFKHPDDGWYEIEAKGNHPNRAAGVVQVIDDEAAQTIVNRFNEDAASGALRQGHEMLIDHEHFSGQDDQESRAYGWLQELQNRADGIYGRIRWTATGKLAVDGGDYRFFSTEYNPQDLKVLNKGVTIPASEEFPAIKARAVKPLRLAGLTLTNMNNNRGQQPITNRAAAGDGTTFADAGASAANQQQPNKKSMPKIATQLGLAAEASEDAIAEAVTKILNRVTTLEPLATENATLKNRIAALEGEQVDSLLELHGVKDEKIINRLKPMLTPLKNREDRVAALTDLGYKVIEAGKPVMTTRVLNRGKGEASQKPVAEPDEAADKARATKITNRAKALMKETPALGLSTAFHMAAQEVE